MSIPISRVSLKGSSVVLPVDLQAHNLTSGDPLPVAQADIGVTATLLTANEVVAAAGVAAGIPDQQFDGYDGFYLMVIPTATHDWEVKASRGLADGTTFLDTSSTRQDIIASGSKNRTWSALIRPMAPNYRLFLRNNSGDSQTYTAYIMKVRRSG